MLFPSVLGMEGNTATVGTLFVYNAMGPGIDSYKVHSIFRDKICSIVTLIDMFDFKNSMWWLFHTRTLSYDN